ncbi:MAG: hypothetical protein ACXWGW_18085, partial [Methylobacter sp.]
MNLSFTCRFEAFTGFDRLLSINPKHRFNESCRIAGACNEASLVCTLSSRLSSNLDIAFEAFSFTAYLKSS